MADENASTHSLPKIANMIIAMSEAIYDMAEKKDWSAISSLWEKREKFLHQHIDSITDKNKLKELQPAINRLVQIDQKIQELIKNQQDTLVCEVKKLNQGKRANRVYKVISVMNQNKNNQL